VIPIPSDFPVSWEKPDDAKFFWTIDRMHLPEPVTRLEYDILARFFEGFDRAAVAYEYGVEWHCRRINTYLYASIIPVPTSPEEMERLAKGSEEKVRAVMARLGQTWNSEYLPEIQRCLAEWAAFDLRGAGTPQLLDHLEESLRRLARLADIHFLTVMPAYTAVSLFDDLYRDLFSGGAFDGYRLLQGIDNKTLETGRALWELSRRAFAAPQVRKVLEEEAAAAVIPTLEGSAEGRAFLTELRVYLDKYGHRGQTCLAIHPSPSWIEDPTPVIKNLKDYIAQPDQHPMAELQRLAEERERLVAEARAQLQGYPQPVVEQFEFLLEAAQEGIVLTEDHAFWIDYSSLYQMRRLFLEFSRRLAEGGVVEAADDVWNLTIEEIRASAKTPADRRALVARRKAEMERFGTVEAPPALGTMPPGPPPDTQMGRVFAKFFGEPPQAEAGAPTNVLKGHAGSPGTVRAPARLVRSLADAGRLRQGDVLVAETTSAPWTPLFATASAIVTDAGGVLSHCAVVAREYRIPAVVGTLMATARIRDGQMLEVDGDAGVVRLL
jgi:pyruvate,water dikinase